MRTSMALSPHASLNITCIAYHVNGACNLAMVLTLKELGCCAVTARPGAPPVEMGSLPIFWISTLLMGLLIRNFNSCMGLFCILRRRRAR